MLTRMAAPSVYYHDDRVTLWLGDCRDLGAWLSADVLITDPPYGRGWSPAPTRSRTSRDMHSGHDGIAGDLDTAARDEALRLWAGRRAMVFGHLIMPPPAGAKQVLIYRKPPDAGGRGGLAGFRRDTEAIYLLGDWPAGLGGLSSVLETGARSAGNPGGIAARYGHPHAKPVDVMEMLAGAVPSSAVIADPFAGSGSTLVAARNLGLRAVGVEIHEPYAEAAAKRLAQDVLITGPVGPERITPAAVLRGRPAPSAVQ